jgi:hypothetical protein
MEREQDQEARIEGLESQPTAGSQPPAAGPGSDAIEQLKQLGALHEQGILTDEEFAAEKAKVLGS